MQDNAIIQALSSVLARTEAKKPLIKTFILSIVVAIHIQVEKTTPHRRGIIATDYHRKPGQQLTPEHNPLIDACITAFHLYKTNGSGNTDPGLAFKR
ncbi:hypothetical protein ACQ86O_01590 [Serratia sp. L9]|uniref:hypothetical protein n=1 Tax=Serratia sp. L9 TaxID=3423946 RepID=UPI003D6692FE